VRPEEVLELMRSAPERYDTVRAALRYTGDGSTIKAIRERFLGSGPVGAPSGGLRSPSRRHTTPSPTGRSAGGRGCGGRTSTAGGRSWICRRRGKIVASTGRLRSRGTPEGPPGTSELWERRLGEAAT
jgi:hypothetical protein